MQIVFDPDKSVVEVRGDLPSERWPFALDCTTGVARIELSDATFEVRPLTWRQTRLLARYGGLGSSFIEFQFLQLAASGRPSPSSSADRQALRTLAMWINGLEGERPVLTSDSLARIEAEVCRALLLHPGDLDDREALDVEATWRSLSSAGQGTESESAARSAAGQSLGASRFGGGDVHRIRILPDPESVVSAPFAVATQPSGTETIRETPRPPSNATDESGLEAARSRAVALPPEPGPASAPSRTQVVGERPFRWAAAAIKREPAPFRRHVRSVLPAISAPSDGALPYKSPVAEIGAVNASAARPVSSTQDIPQSSSGSEFLSQTGEVRTPRTPRTISALSSQAVVMRAAVPAKELEPVPVPYESASQSAPSDIDVDELIDELSDRLEQAAADLGIEVGV